MDRELATTIVSAIFLLAIVGMFVGWRVRSRNQEDIASLAAVPAKTGEVIASAHGLYVATSLHGHPLERITVRGLGFRSRADLTIARAGIVAALTGQEPFFIDGSLVRSSQRATWTIDKGVEKDGLVVITWTMSDREVDSYFRLDGDSDDVVAAVNGLVEVQQ